MSKFKILLFFIILLISSAFSWAFYPESIWKTLGQVKWREKYHPEYKAMVEQPVFTKVIKALDGKVVSIPGYVIPVDFYGGEHGEFIVLSRYPASSCFFCGGGGPESVIEVYLKNKRDYYSLQRIQTFRGKLQLNYNDLNRLIYILNDAEVIRK